MFREKRKEWTYKLKSNKKERTITIREYFNGKLTLKFRSYKLEPEEFHYYSNFATQNDIKNFLKSSAYYIVRY